MQGGVLTLQDIRLKPGSGLFTLPIPFSTRRLAPQPEGKYRITVMTLDFLVVAAVEPDLVEKQRKSPSWDGRLG